MENLGNGSQDNTEHVIPDQADASSDRKEEPGFEPLWNRDMAIAFISQLRDLYSVRSKRFDAVAWERLLMLQPLHDPKNRLLISFTVLDFFLKHPLVPQSVWILYNAFFGWTAAETVVPKECQQWIRTVVRETDMNFPMGFAHVPEDELGEKYMSYRRCMRDSAIDDKRDDVRRYYELATQLFSSDPEVYRVAFRYYDSLKHWEQTSTMIGYAWEALTQYLSLCPNDLKMEIKKPEYLLKRGFDTEALNEYKNISKKYPMHLSILYHRMECFLHLHDKTGASLERNIIRSSYPKISKQLEHDRLQSNQKEEIDVLLAENKTVLDTLNEKYPPSQLSAEEIRHKPYFPYIIIAAVVLVLLGVYFISGGLKNLTGGSTTSISSYTPDETTPDEISKTILNFADTLQARYPSFIFAHSMQYDRYGYLEFSIQSMQNMSEEKQDEILIEISDFVATSKVTYPDAYMPVLWNVHFQMKDESETVYLSDPDRISVKDKYEARDIWQKLEKT